MKMRTKTKVWSDGGLVDWNEGEMKDKEQKIVYAKEDTLDEEEFAPKYHQLVPPLPDHQNELDIRLASRGIKFVEANPDNLEFENEGDLTIRNSWGTNWTDWPKVTSEVQDDHKSLDTSNWDLPQIYESYIFPSLWHRGQFLMECIAAALITACIWTEAEEESEGFPAVVHVSMKGVDLIGAVARRYQGKEF